MGTHRHTDTQTHRHTDTHSQTHRHTDTQTHRHIDTQTHRNTDTQTHRHTDTNNEKDKKTMRKQDTIRDKITKEFPLTVETTNFHEEECNEINNTTKTREMEGTLEYYRKLIKEKDKIDQITEESLKNNRNILQKSERTNLELIKYSQNEKIIMKNKQERRLIPSGKV